MASDSIYQVSMILKETQVLLYALRVSRVALNKELGFLPNVAQNICIDVIEPALFCFLVFCLVLSKRHFQNSVTHGIK